MKKIFFLFVPFILFSCGQNSENSVADNLRIDIDTVMVDAGDEIIYLERGLHYSTLSPDRKHLYNFNNYDNSLEKIDLEELRLVEKLPFEKEGPNGTGNDVYYMNMLDDNHIHMADFWTSSQFHLDGTITASHNLYDHGFKGDVLTEYEQWKNSIVVPGQPGVLFALVSNWEEGTFNLRRIDFGQKQIKKYDFDQGGEIPRYTFRVPSMSKQPIISPSLYLSMENGNLIISSDITSEIHLYDPIGDSLISKKNSYRLTANEKKGRYTGEYASIEDLMADYQKVLEEISFYPPVWDKDKEQHYRFSYRVKFGEEKELGALLPNDKRTHVYLSVYDKNFDPVAESPVPQLVNTPAQHFVREGKIWIVKNMDDELAFIRLKVGMDADLNEN